MISPPALNRAGMPLAFGIPMAPLPTPTPAKGEADNQPLQFKKYVHCLSSLTDFCSAPLQKLQQQQQLLLPLQKKTQVNFGKLLRIQKATCTITTLKQKNLLGINRKDSGYTRSNQFTIR